ncbi:MAG: type IV pilus biogenesis protein PilM [Planctomycetota bacterium]|jgi:Tfp pilus assembly PilM family ATPase
MAGQTVIEYGGRRVRLLHFDGSGRKVRLLGVAEAELPEVVAGGEEGAQEAADLHATAIDEALDDAGFPTDPSAMAFDAGHAMFREFDLPFTSDEQIAKVVRFESESHFPGDIDDYVIQHVVQRKTRDKSHLLVCGVKKDDLLDRLEILEEAGLDPMLVDIDDLALYQALIETGVAAEHPHVAVLNAQDTTTSLLVLVDGKLFALRSIRVGAGSVAKDVRSGDVDSDVETAHAHEYLMRLRREIRRTLSTLPEMEELDALYVLGGGSRVPGFAEAVGEALGREPESLDLLEHVDHKLSAADAERYGPDIGVLLGMAYKLNGLDATRTDFRREEVAYTRKFDQIKTPLIVMSFLAFLVVAFLGLDAYMNVNNRLEREYETILAHGQEQLAMLLGDDAEARAKWQAQPTWPRKVQAQLDAVRDLREEIAQKLGRSTTIPDLQSALAVWIEFSNVLADNEQEIGRFALQGLTIEALGNSPSLKISGQVEDLTHYSLLIDLLEERPMFRDVEAGSTQPTSDGVRFSDLTVWIDFEPDEEGTS